MVALQTLDSRLMVTMLAGTQHNQGGSAATLLDPGTLKTCGHSDAAEKAFSLSPRERGAAGSLLVTHRKRIHPEQRRTETDSFQKGAYSSSGMG